MTGLNEPCEVKLGGHIETMVRPAGNALGISWADTYRTTSYTEAAARHPDDTQFG